MALLSPQAYAHPLCVTWNPASSDADIRLPKAKAFFLPRSTNKTLFLSTSQNLKCRANKWADRLFSDFEDPSHAAVSNVTVLPPERKFTLPIDFYQVLGAETHFLGDGIRRAYEAAVRRVPHEDYSEEALLGRRDILQSACDTLANPRSRGDYNQGLLEDEARTLMRDVPWHKVPGALCLLQEVGEADIVIQAGQKLLREHLPKSFKRDVILAMALSYIDVSREAMAESKQDIIKSCEALEHALQLLQEGGGKSLALNLQEQIDETLEELAPRYVLEILALPLDEQHRVRREEGLQRVRNILWTVGDRGAVASIAGFSREEFMNEAFLRMTAAEQVDLFSATPNSIPAESFEVYSAALAHIAEGFVGKKPQLIQEADSLFMQLQQTAGISMESTEDSPELVLAFALERGMCALLLGQLESCQHWLGLDSLSSPYRDTPIIEFIQSNSSKDDDMQLSGLCKLLESWLTEIVFPRFKDTHDIGFKLRDYYDDPDVLKFLEKLDKGRGSPLAAAAAIAKIGAGAGAAIDTVKSNAIQALKKVFPFAKEAVNRRATSTSISGTLIEENAVGSSSKAYTVRDALHEYNARGGDTHDMLDVTTSKDIWASTDAIGREKSSAYSKFYFSAMKIASGAIITGAIVIAGIRSYYKGHHGSLQPETQVQSSSATTISTTSDGTDLCNVKMDARLAENLVRKWQLIKSQALGPNHDVSELPEILDGEMLNIWKERAREIAEHGWFWEYSLLGLSIDSVTISKDGKRAMVEVTLQEAARLIDNNHPEHNDSYRTTYTTRYEMNNSKGSWKITDGAVLRS
eukprot:TRINITY_DN25681_c0_g1_i1.p1 TRINITY_DN25681_c0_g1~~TRINITY_DN25681_c0_g1_i1.p1  ORF type:complete len:807 (-),score=168.71 TRINITY_DN25681_c0_g1_i1:164-2584(-)